MTKTKPKKSQIKKKTIKIINKKSQVKKKDIKKTRTKYNWALMKQEFMTSEHLEATGFLRAEYGLEHCKSNSARKKTKGWSEEKKEFAKEIYRQTMESVAEKRVEKNTDVLDKLMDLLDEKITEESKAKLLSVKDLERLWGIFQTMNNKPTRYIKNDNTSVVIPVKELTDEEKESLQEKLKLNGLI